jgi:hypothetical protein
VAIQRRFLKSIEDSNAFFEIELIVIQFQEKWVKETLSNYKVNHHLISLDSEIPFFRFSLSDVLSKGLSASSGEITIYTTCDVVITPALLGDIKDALLPNGVVIPSPYPEMPFGADEKDAAKFMLEDPASTGIDIFAFSKIARDKFNSLNYFSRHRLLGWGMFDHLIIMGCLKLNIPLTKISALNSTIKYHNDREQNNESMLWLNTCHAYNVLQFRKYVGIDVRFLSLISLKGLHEAVEKNNAPISKIFNQKGLSLVKKHFLELLKHTK